MWSSTNELFQFYKRHCCQDNDIEPVSRTIFFKVFTEENISIYILKKDLCDTCVAYDTKNLSQEEYDVHQKMKKEAREEKNKEKEFGTAVFTMDLQAVLLCPKSTVSSMYYKTKLVVHNFTLFNLKTQEGYCFFVVRDRRWSFFK